MRVITSIFVQPASMKLITLLILMCMCLVLTGCGSLLSSAKKEFAEDLSATMLESTDPETVGQAIPAYLLLISSMIRGDQENTGLLLSGSKLYGAYASIFVENVPRKVRLSSQAFEYAERALCLQQSNACDIKSMTYFEYERLLQSMEKGDVDVLFAYASAWAGLIEANRSDWNAIAELPKVKATIERVIALDETVSNGDAHLYMGVIESLLPPAMGGKAELARLHYEKALEISNRSNLMAMLLYAEKYARLIFDEKLHDQLLNEVINAKLVRSDYKLINTIAKQRAGQLLAEDYF